MYEQTYLATVKNIPQDTEADSGGAKESFTYRMRELVGQQIIVERTEYRGWYQQVDGYRFWFHQSWLTNIQEYE